MKHYNYMKHFIQKSIFSCLFLSILFSAFAQSNKPYAKNINIDIKDEKVILTWENPKDKTEIKNILIYGHKNPITSQNQLTKENLIAKVNKEFSELLITDINQITPYYAVIYELNNGKTYDSLIISENTTVYDQKLSLFIESKQNKDEDIKREKTEILTKNDEPSTRDLRTLPLPNISISKDSNSYKNPESENKVDKKIIPHIFEEDSPEKAVGISYEISLIISNYFESANYPKAIEEFKVLLQNNQDANTTARIYFYLGECYYFTQQHAQALNCFLQSEKVYSALSKKWQQYVINSFSY